MQFMHYCSFVSGSDLIRRLYIRFFKPLNEKSTSLTMGTAADVDEYFEPVAHLSYHDCFDMVWTRDMLNVGIYYVALTL